MKKSDLSENEFAILFSLVFDNIDIIPEFEYKEMEQNSEKDICDVDDMPYIATCIVENASGIWTHDKNLMKQNKVKTLTNIDMIELIRRSEYMH